MNWKGVHIAVASGKGGTGKTTIATNLAQVISRNGNDVIYADCDAEEPNGHLFLSPESEKQEIVNVMIPGVLEEKCNLCGICSEICEFNAIAVFGPKVTLFPSLCHGCCACVVLCPEQALFESRRPIGFIRSGNHNEISIVGGSLRVGESQAPPVVKALKKTLPGDATVIIDSPPGSSCPVVESVRNSDYVVLVTEPTPFGLHDLKLAVEMIRRVGLPFGVIINRSDIGDSRVIDYCQKERIPILMQLPFERKIAEAYSEGILAVDIDASFCRRMHDLVLTIQKELESA